MNCKSYYISILIISIFIIPLKSTFAENKDNSSESLSYLGKGEKSYNEKKYDQAIQMLNKSIELDSKCFDAYMLLGNCFMRKNDYNKSLYEFKRALKISESDKNKSKVYNKIGMIYYMLKSCSMADENLKKAMDLDPENIEASINFYVVQKNCKEEKLKESIKKNEMPDQNRIIEDIKNFFRKGDNRIKTGKNKEIADDQIDIKFNVSSIKVISKQMKESGIEITAAVQGQEILEDKTEHYQIWYIVFVYRKNIIKENSITIAKWIPEITFVDTRYQW